MTHRFLLGLLSAVLLHLPYRVEEEQNQDRHLAQNDNWGNAFCEITKRRFGARKWKIERTMSRSITDQHVEIINQLGLQTAEESRLEHLELKQGVFLRQLGSYMELMLRRRE